jgi:hypothetical protein
MSLKQKTGIDLTELELETDFLSDVTRRIDNDSQLATHTPRGVPYNPIEYGNNSRVHCVIIDETDEQIWVETGVFKNQDNKTEFYVAVQLVNNELGEIMLADHVYRTDDKTQSQIESDLDDEQLVYETVSKGIELMNHRIDEAV